MGRNIFCEQLHIRKGSAGLGETGGGLDIICAGIGNALAQGDLLLVGQQTGLDDDLQELAVAGSLDGSDLGGQVFPLAFLSPADPACAYSSPAFLMMYSAQKLNKQGDNIQP